MFKVLAFPFPLNTLFARPDHFCSNNCKQRTRVALSHVHSDESEIKYGTYVFATEKTPFSSPLTIFLPECAWKSDTKADCFAMLPLQHEYIICFSADCNTIWSVADDGVLSKECVW